MVQPNVPRKTTVGQVMVQMMDEVFRTLPSTTIGAVSNSCPAGLDKRQRGAEIGRPEGLFMATRLSPVTVTSTDAVTGDEFGRTTATAGSGTQAKPNVPDVVEYSTPLLLTPTSTVTVALGSTSAAIPDVAK